jgi:hypothetical protein
MNKEDIEYAHWVWADTARQLLPAVAIYVVALGAYWIFIG